MGVPIPADRMIEVVDNAGLDVKNVADDHLKKLIQYNGMYFRLEDVALWTNAQELAEFRCARRA